MLNLKRILKKSKNKISVKFVKSKKVNIKFFCDFINLPEN